MRLKLRAAVISSAIFCVLLAIAYLIHVWFFDVDVVFYAAIADGVFAAAVAGVLLFSLDWFRALSEFERVQLLIIWLLFGYAFAISVPTVIDRSLSFYILEKLQQRGGGIRLDAFEGVITKEYVVEHRLVDVRITEQEQSGTVIIEGGCVKLTARGDGIATFSRFFRQHLLPKKRLLMGHYSDSLTNPFRNSINDPGYTCR